MPPSDRTIGKLVLSVGGRILRELLIDRKRVTIGRRPYNDLLLDDLTVSGEHAIIHTGPKGEAVVHDLQSRNGTLVNGMPVMQQVLSDGDVIDVGIYRIVYRTERLGINVNAFVHQELPPSAMIRPEDGAPGQPLDPDGSAGPAGGFGGRPASTLIARHNPASPSWTSFLGAGRTGSGAAPAGNGAGSDVPASATPADGRGSDDGADPGTKTGAVDGTSGPFPPIIEPPTSPASEPPQAAPGLPSLPPGSMRAPTLPPSKGGPGAPMPPLPFSPLPFSQLPSSPLPSSPLPSSPLPSAPRPVPVDPWRSGRVLIRYLGGHDAGREVVMDRPIVSIRNGSGQVAVIARRQGNYYLTHLEGLAYPLVNGESIGLGAHALRDNDLIELAGTILQFCLDGPAP